MQNKFDIALICRSCNLKKSSPGKLGCFLAMVVVQLAEQFLPIPEVRGSNPVIGKKIIMDMFTVEKTKIKKKSQKVRLF